MKKKKGRIGASLDEFLKQEGIYEEVTARAIKRVIARQLDALMQDQGLTKSSLAKRMKTSRAQLGKSSYGARLTGFLPRLGAQGPRANNDLDNSLLTR